MHLHTVSETRATLWRAFSRAQRRFQSVNGRLTRKIDASSEPGAKEPWPDSKDYAKYLQTSKALEFASEALSEHCRAHRVQ